MKNACIFVSNGHITVKFCTGVVHEKPIAHTKQNFEISTDVIDNDVIILKFELVKKHSALKAVSQ